MSRRSRKRNQSEKTPLLGKIFITLSAIILISIVASYIILRSHLHSESFRKFLSAQASSVLKIRGEFSPFLWDGLAVETPSFKASGNGLIAHLTADQINTEIGFRAITHGTWEIKNTRISRLDIALNPTPPTPTTPPTPPASLAKPSQKNPPSWLPQSTKIDSLHIGELTLTTPTPNGPVTARRMAISILPASGEESYTADISGGSIALPSTLIPLLRIGEIRGSYRSSTAFITKADLSAFQDAHITAFGEYNTRTSRYSFQGDATQLKCDELLSETWARRLTGDISSSFTLQNSSGTPTASGYLTIQNATLTALPMLEALAAYADTRRFRTLQLSEARTKWSATNGEVHLTDLSIASEGLIRLEGSVTIIGQEIDGRLRLGIIPGILSHIPGAETDVFSPGPLGLLWTDLHLTGTLQDPHEDLTQRLLTAAGLRMFEQLPQNTEKILKFTRSALGENPTSTIEKGQKILTEGEKSLQQAQDLLKKFLNK